MDNNDILIRIRYALDIKDPDMVEIFKLGGVELSVEEVRSILIKTRDSYHDNEIEGEPENIKCNHQMLESFLNGLIIYKRGKSDPNPGQPDRPILSIKGSENLNNIMLKKMKIALSLSSEDMLNIFEQSGLNVTKGELSALFRKEGHKHYKECGDKYARSFLKGLTIKNRG